MLKEIALGGLLMIASLTCNAKDVVIKLSADEGRSFMGKGHYTIEQIRTILHPGKSDGFWLKVHDVRDDSYIGAILFFVPPKSSKDSKILLYCNADLSKDLLITFDINGFKQKTLKLDGRYKTYEIELKKE